MIITFDTTKDSTVAMQAVLDAIASSNGGSADPATVTDRPVSKPRKKEEVKQIEEVKTEAPKGTEAVEVTETQVTNTETNLVTARAALTAKAKAWYIVNSVKDDAKFKKVKDLLAQFGAAKMDDLTDVDGFDAALDKLINGAAPEPPKQSGQSGGVKLPENISELRAYIHPHGKAGDPLQSKVMALLDEVTGKTKSTLGDLKKEQYGEFCTLFDELKKA